MLEAASAAVRIYCPECGAGLRAARADAGAVLSCYACGEAIRVPRRPHPLESEPDTVPLIPVDPTISASTGLRLLTASVLLSVLGYALLVTAITCWVAAEGPAAVFAREHGEVRTLLLTLWRVDLGVVLVAAALRWVAYRRCEPAAAVLRAGPWVTAALVGVVVRSIGYVLVVLPWLGGLPVNDTPIVLKALGEIGKLGLVVGWALEFGIVVLWSRMMGELHGRDAVRRVGRYIATTLGAVVATATAVCLAGMMMVLTLRRSGPAPHHPGDPPPRLDFDVVPPEGWYTVLGACVVAAAFGLVLAWQYLRLLAALRSGLHDTLPR